MKPSHGGITFQNYNGESVTVSGADQLGNWSNYGNSIYQAPMSWDLGEGNNQVFVNGTMVNEARWPEHQHRPVIIRRLRIPVVWAAAEATSPFTIRTFHPVGRAPEFT